MTWKRKEIITLVLLILVVALYNSYYKTVESYSESKKCDIIRSDAIQQLKGSGCSTRADAFPGLELHPDGSGDCLLSMHEPLIHRNQGGCSSENVRISSLPVTLIKEDSTDCLEQYCRIRFAPNANRENTIDDLYRENIESSKPGEALAAQLTSTQIDLQAVRNVYKNEVEKTKRALSAATACDVARAELHARLDVL
jgi:hypothetical protein